MPSHRFGRNIIPLSLWGLPGWLEAVAKKKPHWDFRVKVDLGTTDGVVTSWLSKAEIKAILDSKLVWWARRDEIAAAYAKNRIIAVHEAEIDLGGLGRRAEWIKLRNETLKRYGRRCMACGCTEEDDRIEVDHIRSWMTYPEGRFDPQNLQVLCRSCNTSRNRTAGPAEDFRPKAARPPKKAAAKRTTKRKA